MQKELSEKEPCVEKEVMEKEWDTMSMSEIAGVLRELGIEVPEDTVTSMEEAWKDYPEEVAESLDEGAMLLSVLGMGKYNYETWEWTPGSEQDIPCIKVQEHLEYGKLLAKGRILYHDILSFLM